MKWRKLSLGLLLIVGLIWVSALSIGVTAQSQTTVIPNVYHGSWFQPEALQYRVKMTATTFTFGGGYYEHEHWQPHNQVTYRLSSPRNSRNFYLGKTKRARISQRQSAGGYLLCEGESRDPVC